MESVNNDTVEIDVKEIFFVLLHKLWLIILFGLLGASCAWAINKYLVQPVYTSTTKVYVINRQEDTRTTLSDLQTGTQLTKDYMILVKSRPVTETVIRDLGLNMSGDQLAGSIQVNTPEDTRILEIQVSDHDPALAKKLADSIAEISSERMVSVMGMEKVNIMEEGNLPQSPSSPNVMKNTMLGGLFGVMLISIIIVLVYLMNDCIRTTDDIEKYLGITSLGMLPIEENSKIKKSKKQREKKHSERKQNAA